MNYHFEQEGIVPSPALIYYKDQIERNTEEAIRIAGGAGRMWPHVKTHKMSEMIKMQIAMGVRRFKCATVSEIRMAAGAGAEHILWAYPLVGPNIGLFLQLAGEFPQCMLYALEDDPDCLRELSAAACAKGMRANVLLDINIGMDRTGMPLEKAEEFYREAEQMPGVRIRGLHCYDGHIHDHDLNERREHAHGGAEASLKMREHLNGLGYDCGIVILGGTPTFPCHAQLENVFLSPGTLFVSDAGYCGNFPDIAVQPAAAVLTRVISHPAEGLFTLDTGTKAISADANPRGVLFGMEEKCTPVLSSEEHWVFKMNPGCENERPAVGSVLFAVPTHICPTTTLYDAAYVCENGRLTGVWKVDARSRVADTLQEGLL